MVSFETACISDIGKRRTVNQDRIFLESAIHDGKAYALFAVADGMGGLSNGERAAEICVQGLMGWWEKNVMEAAIRPSPKEARQTLYDAFSLANISIQDDIRREGKNMGSTLTAAYFCDNDYLLVHVGDCRVYKIKRRSAVMLTSDHTWVAKQVEAGLLTGESAETHPQRHVLINCVGAAGNFFVDMAAYSLSEGETLLLCSDGLYKYIKQRSMPKYFRKYGVKQGLNQILEYIYQLPADDNISGVAVKIASQSFSMRNLFLNG